MLCSQCNTNNPPGTTYCSNCGDNLLANSRDNNNFQPTPNYVVPPPQYTAGTNLEEPVSFKEWMLTYLIMMIPIVGTVMMFVWAFGSGAKKSKSNYFKAALLWGLIIGVLYALFYVIMMVVVIGAFSGDMNDFFAAFSDTGGYDPSYW